MVSSAAPLTFIAPVLPLAPRRSTSTSIRVLPTASLRFPNGGRSSGSFKLPSFRLPSFPNFSRGSFGGPHFSGPSGRDGGRDGGRGGGRSEGGAGGASGGSDGNIFTNIWAAYCAKLEAYPIATKALTSFVGFMIGDILAQKYVGEKSSDIDWPRVGRMASFGFLIHGPTGHFFYSALDRLIVGTSPLKVISKVAIDQVLWAPIFTAAFFAYLGFTEGKSAKDVKKKIQDDTWIGVTTSWKFWPLAHTINFAFIPTAQRLLYINTLQVGYNVILSLLGNK